MLRENNPEPGLPILEYKYPDLITLFSLFIFITIIIIINTSQAFNFTNIQNARPLLHHRHFWRTRPQLRLRLGGYRCLRRQHAAAARDCRVPLVQPAVWRPFLHDGSVGRVGAQVGLQVGGSSLLGLYVSLPFLSPRQKKQKLIKRKDKTALVGSVPFFRWYNAQSHDHFYTLDDEGELAPTSGYTKEGILGYVFLRPGTAGTVPLFRWWKST